METESSNDSAKRSRNRVSRACVQCKKSHTACDDYRPCHRCVHLGKGDQCRDAEVKRRGRPPKRHKTSENSGSGDEDSDDRHDSLKGQDNSPTLDSGDHDNGNHPFPSMSHIAPNFNYQKNTQVVPNGANEPLHMNHHPSLQIPPISLLDHTRNPHNTNGYQSAPMKQSNSPHNYHPNSQPQMSMHQTSFSQFQTEPSPMHSNSYHHSAPPPQKKTHSLPLASNSSEINTMEANPIESSVTMNGNAGVDGQKYNQFISVFAHLVDEVRELKQLSKNLLQDQHIIRAGLRQVANSQYSNNQEHKNRTDLFSNIQEIMALLKSERSRIQFHETLMNYRYENKPFAILHCGMPSVPDISTIITASETFCRVLGYSSLSEVVGLLHSEIIHSKSEDKCSFNVKNALVRQTGASSEVISLSPLLKTKNGEILDARTTFQLFSRATESPSIGVMTIEFTELVPITSTLHPNYTRTTAGFERPSYPNSSGVGNNSNNNNNNNTSSGSPSRERHYSQQQSQQQQSQQYVYNTGEESGSGNDHLENEGVRGINFIPDTKSPPPILNMDEIS